MTFATATKAKYLGVGAVVLLMTFLFIYNRQIRTLSFVAKPTNKHFFVVAWFHFFFLHNDLYCGPFKMLRIGYMAVKIQKKQKLIEINCNETYGLHV